MLLSEILLLAKDKRKLLNESYKSSVIKNIYDDINNSTYKLSAYDKKTGRIRVYSPDSYSIERFYTNLYKEGKLTQEWFDDPEKREELISLTYRKDTGDRAYRKKISPMLAISDSLRRYGLNIDLSEITDDDLEKIWMFELREKPSIKKQLTFWFNSDDHFVALSYGKDIIVYNKISSLSWYKVNPEYTGPTNITDMIDYDRLYSIFKYEEFRDFLHKAFVEIPSYTLYFLTYFDKDDFKDVLKQNTKPLTKLIKEYDISYAYVLDRKHLKKVDISDKITDRTKYREFLKLQEIWLKLSTNKKRGRSLKISRLVYDVYESICDSLELLLAKELERLQEVSDMQFSKPFEDEYEYNIDTVIAKTYYDLIDKPFPDDKENQSKIEIKISYEGLMFSLATAFILYALHLADIIFKEMESIETIKKENEHDVDKLITEYNNMNSTFNSLKRWLGKLYKFNVGYMSQLKQHMLALTDIDILDITKVFEPYYDSRTVYL